MSINSFKSQLAGGGSRANQFRVILTFPNYVPTGPLATLKAGFLVTAAALPASTLGTTPVYYRGREVKYSGERRFAPWQVTVLNDTDFVIRNALEIWQQGISENATNKGRVVASQYQATAIVQQLDRNDNILKQYEFIDIYPSVIGDIPLDYSTNDVLETFPVTFDYSYWTADILSTVGAIGIGAGVLAGNIPTTGA